MWCFSRLIMDLLRENSASPLHSYGSLRRVVLLGLHSFMFVGVLRLGCALYINVLDQQDSRRYSDLTILNVTYHKHLGSGWIRPYQNADLDIHISFLKSVDSCLQILFLYTAMQGIYNIWQLCEMPQLEHINANTKFLGTRLLIIVAQLQSTALELASLLPRSIFPYSLYQARLLHASLMCFECCGVCFLHMCFWPSEDYCEGRLPLEDKSMREALLHQKEPPLIHECTSSSLLGHNGPVGEMSRYARFMSADSVKSGRFSFSRLFRCFGRGHSEHIDN